MRRFLSVLMLLLWACMATAACSSDPAPEEDMGLSETDVSDVSRGDDVPVDKDLAGIPDEFVPEVLDMWFFEIEVVEEIEIVDIVDDEGGGPEVDVVEIEDEQTAQPTDLGKPCETDLDCSTDGGCRLGFCTSYCKAGGETIPGACSNPYPEGPWGLEFACPDDMNVCMPGKVGGKTVTCSTDTDCTAQELPGYVCGGAFVLTEVEVGGRCLPLLDRKPLGTICLDNAGICGSLLCLHPGMDDSLNGMCTAFCDDDTACPSGSVCAMYPLYEDDGDDLLGYAPLCVPIEGSLDECSTGADCKYIGKEYCGVVFEPDTYAPKFICMESQHQSGAWVGEVCGPTAFCFGSWCMFEDWANKVDAYCTFPCKDDAGCSPDTACKTARVAPFEGVLPYGPFEVGVCLKEAEGSPCFTAAQGVCEFEWSSCQPIPGIFGLGTCVDGECPPNCDGKACKEDNGCGEPCLDACLPAGDACLGGAECLSDFCADGVCCDTACDGLCESCAQENLAGICSAYVLGDDPDGECGLCQACDGAGACAPFGLGADPNDQCEACHVCGAEGECVPVGDGLDPEMECGACQWCDGAGACGPMPYGSDPNEDCEETEYTSCLTTGVCNGEGSCELWNEGTPCGDPQCTLFTFVPPAECNGKGVCSPQPGKSCAPFLCNEDAAACLEGCNDSGDCSPGNWCVDDVCEPLPACPVETKLICNATVPGTTLGLSNDWFDYGCVPGIAYNGPDRIYSVKMDVETKVTVTLLQAEFDASLMLLQYACSPENSCANYADLFPAGGEETMNFTAEAGVQYHLAVDGFASGDSGKYNIMTECCQVQCAEENACGDDGCGGSCGICGDDSLCHAGQCLACADDPLGEPNDACDESVFLEDGIYDGNLLCPDSDVDWFEVELTEGQTLSVFLEFDVEAANLDLALYGSDCNTFVTDSTSSDETELLSYQAFEPGTFKLLVYSPNWDETDYDLVIDIADPECLDDNDCFGMEVCGLYECLMPPAPCQVTGEPVCSAFIAGDTTGKQTDFVEYTSCTDMPLEGPEDIYKMSFQEEVVVTVTLAGQAFTGAVAIMEKYCATEWACVTSSVGQQPGIGVVAQFKAKPGVLYYMVVEGVTANDYGTYSFDVSCCIPQCDGKECGADSCGLSCGECPGEADVCIDGVCECVPSCDGKECGDDGCGGDCGECLVEQHLCVENMCVCQPSCDGKECGGDGCDGTCGECEDPMFACEEGICVCQPECDGKECGDDGCEGLCGECEGEQNVCNVELGLCECQPTCEGKECGDDGCGGDCGACPGLQDDCVDYACVCQPDCDGKACGDDGCEGLCGVCGKAESCQNFQCACSDDGGIEPNNTCQQALAVTPAVYPDLAICSGGDHDWYSIQLGAGQTLTVKALFIHADGDLDLYLFKQGNCFGYEKNSSSSTDDEQIVHTSSTQSTYLIKVTGLNATISNTYTLDIAVN